MNQSRETSDRPDVGALPDFAVECPGCGERVAVAAGLARSGARCPACGTAFLVPESDGHARSVDEPIVFAEPPPPSTRGPARDAPSPEASPPDTPAGLPPALTPDDSYGLAFRDPVRTVRSGDAEIELRRLTPEEKRVRRARRSLLILAVGAALLVALAVILGGGRR